MRYTRDTRSDMSRKKKVRLIQCDFEMIVVVMVLMVVHGIVICKVHTLTLSLILNSYAPLGVLSTGGWELLELCGVLPTC
jgi:hypothetical protein